jgi:Na+-driven multidrug efflux pump
MSVAVFEKVAEATAGIELNPQIHRLLHDPIVPTLLRMAWPNILIMLAQASTGLIEAFWVARLGTDALAGMALVFPIVMMVQMIATGAMGGGISSAIARGLGAGRRDEADALVLHVAGALAFALTEGIGLATAIWPERWLTLFSAEPGMIKLGSAYLQIVGPAYGFFGLGLSLYFASQGAGRLFWPLFYGLVRVFIAIVGGWAALRLTGSLDWMFAALALGLLVYGVAVAGAIGSRAWFRNSKADAR